LGLKGFVVVVVVVVVVVDEYLFEHGRSKVASPSMNFVMYSAAAVTYS